MALNGSGPISLAGSTAGQSIALELGRSSTATTSLDESAVRTLLGVSSGTIGMNSGYGKSNNPVTSISGLVGWYDVSSVSGSTWTDKSGNGNHASIVGGASVVSVSGKGATNLTSALAGTTSQGVNFPAAILPPTYTLFHVTSWQNNSSGRIFQGTSQNWLSGHWGGTNGCAYHQGWLTPQTNIHGTNWVISTDQNTLYRSNGITRGTSGAGSPNYDRISINGNGVYSGEFSPWYCVEVIVYNTNLSSTNYGTIETYLANKYGIA
jgi:hypothetical protein